MDRIDEIQRDNLRASLRHYMSEEDAERVWQKFAEKYPDPREMHARLAIALAERVIVAAECK